MFYPIRRYTLNGGIMPAKMVHALLQTLKSKQMQRIQGSLKKAFQISQGQIYECVYL